MGWEVWETFLEGMVWHKKTSGKCEWLMERSPWWDSGDADFDQKEGTHYSEDWMKIAWLELKGEEGLFLAKLIRLWLQSRTWPGKEKVAWPCGRKDRVAMVTEISWFGEHLFWALLVKTLYFVSGGLEQPILTWPECGFPQGTLVTYLVMATHCGVLFHFSSSPSVLSGGAPARPHTSSPGSGTSLSSFGPWDLSGGLVSDRKWGALYKTPGAKNTTREHDRIRMSVWDAEPCLWDTWEWDEAGGGTHWKDRGQVRTELGLLTPSREEDQGVREKMRRDVQWRLGEQKPQEQVLAQQLSLLRSGLSTWM